MPLLTMRCIVAIDVAKTKFVAAIATASGDAVKLVKFEHPRQTGLFLDQLSILTKGGRKPTVVTYGDAVRYQCPSGADGAHDAAEAYARLCRGLRRRSEHA